MENSKQKITKNTFNLSKGMKLNEILFTIRNEIHFRCLKLDSEINSDYSTYEDIIENIFQESIKLLKNTKKS